MGRPNTASPSSAARPQDSDKSRNASFRLAVHLSILRLCKVQSVHEITLSVVPPAKNCPSAKLRVISHNYETHISVSLPRRTVYGPTEHRKSIICSAAARARMPLFASQNTSAFSASTESQVCTSSPWGSFRQRTTTPLPNSGLSHILTKHAYRQACHTGPSKNQPTTARWYPPGSRKSANASLRLTMHLSILCLHRF